MEPYPTTAVVSMTSATKTRRRLCGKVETLPSGSLTDVVPAGPKAAAQAEKVRTRLLAEVDEKRNPRTSATVGQLLDRYLDVLKIEDTTRVGYERVIRRHIRPLVGDLPIGQLNGETVDSLYAQLRMCSAHCGGRAYTVHRTDHDHDCDERCGPHRCTPLGEAYLRQIHNVLNGAFVRAVKWRWIGTNPLTRRRLPLPQHQTRSRPHRLRQPASRSRRGRSPSGGSSSGSR